LKFNAKIIHRDGLVDLILPLQASGWLPVAVEVVVEVPVDFKERGSHVAGVDLAYVPGIAMTFVRDSNSIIECSLTYRLLGHFVVRLTDDHIPTITPAPI
tara:strand:- start:2115 stop:2414 length:300 start_codon:yes stop_codon:yes gene_type:complete